MEPAFKEIVMPRFVLPNAPEGQVIIGGRYAFVDGVMSVPKKSEAEKLSKILCRFHGCQLVQDEAVEVEVEVAPPSNGSLAAEVTKVGQAEKSETKDARKPEVKAAK